MNPPCSTRRTDSSKAGPDDRDIERMHFCLCSVLSLLLNCRRCYYSPLVCYRVKHVSLSLLSSHTNIFCFFLGSDAERRYPWGVGFFIDSRRHMGATV